MPTRIKLRCSEKTITEQTVSLSFVAVIGGSPENDSFFKWTPAANANFQAVAKEIGAGYEVGKEYYFDISDATPVEAQQVISTDAPAAPISESPAG